MPNADMYNETDSVFYEELPYSEDNYVNLTYGIGEAKGRLIQDRVCLD
jgi:hypothetical protein